VTETSSLVDWDEELLQLKVHRVCTCSSGKAGAPAFCGYRILGVEVSGYQGRPCTNCVRIYAIGHRCPRCGIHWQESRR
jgi:hypothetical protein